MSAGLPAHFHLRTDQPGLASAQRVTSDFAAVKHCIGVKADKAARNVTSRHCDVFVIRQTVRIRLYTAMLVLSHDTRNKIRLQILNGDISPVDYR